MTATYDDARAANFGQRMLEVLNHAALALMTSLGHRTGLFDVMSRMPPASSGKIAMASRLSERYVREWLGAMVTAGVVEYYPQHKTYHLPAEHAASLTRQSNPANLAATAQWIGVLAGAEEDVLEAFHHGKGVPYSSYPRFHEVMAEESAQTVVSGLQEYILPLVPDLPGNLAKGIDVLDVGCGSGGALLRMAELYPTSRFVGYDFSEESIRSAHREAHHAGVRNVRFEVRDVATIEDDAAFDLVTAFDAIHDQARPGQVLHNIRRSLRPRGLFLMQEIRASTHVHQNIDHPMAPFLYTISCMHCMSVSLANGGPGLGATWGRESALAMLRLAGFGNVRVEQLPHDIMNDYYIAAPRA